MTKLKDIFTKKKTIDENSLPKIGEESNNKEENKKVNQF